MNINIDNLSILQLVEESDVSSFVCSDKDLEEFLKEDAKQYFLEKIALTYLVYLDSNIVGFFSLSMGCIQADSVRSRMGIIETEIQKFPVHLIARMATHENYQNNGIGRKMLMWAHAITFHLCKYTGCRFIKVDAKNNEKTVNFYQNKGGFIEISRNDKTVQMVLDINKTPELT